MGFLIREYRPADVSAVRQCVVELQDFERALDSRLRPGETMADAYCERIHARCAESDGRLFVAEQDESVVGFVAVFSREPFTELDDPPGTYALISDLIVLSAYRGKGIGRQLLQRAEAFARDADARELRIGVLLANLAARRLYLDCGFASHLEILVKRW
jgi:ribosomal protein S18 acetylase RimI-like enzyme